MAQIVTYYKGEMLFESRIGKHVLTVDVPADMGGEDRGPIPPQLFVASLGSCIGAFVAQYCEINGINDTDMTVEMSYEKTANPTRLKDLKATVKLPHGDCGARIKAIERVADLCPVHETIKTMNGLAITILGKGDGALN